MSEFKHIDCMCSSYNHLVRIYHDSEIDSFCFEYRLMKFPNKMNVEKIYWCSSIIKYFKNIFTAIFGLPNTFVACSELDGEGAKKLADFIYQQLKKK